jgi:hypothetical protein
MGEYYWVALFDSEEGGIYFEGNVGLFGVVFAFGFELVATFFEFVTGAFEENKAEHDVFVFGGFDGAAEFVGGVPEGFFDGNDFIFFSHEMVSDCY